MKDLRVSFNHLSHLQPRSYGTLHFEYENRKYVEDINGRLLHFYLTVLLAEARSVSMATALFPPPVGINCRWLPPQQPPIPYTQEFVLKGYSTEN